MTLVSVLRRPRWFVLALLMAVLLPGSLRLGFWQLERLEQRRALNAVWEARLASGRAPLEVVVANGGTISPDDLRFLPVKAAGEYLGAEQVLVRNRPEGGVSGSWVVAPLRVSPDLVVAVLRGWVPFEVVDPLDPRIRPPSGVTTVEGVLMPGEHPTAVGPTDPEGERLSRMAVLDLDRLGAQVGVDLGEVYFQQTAPRDLPKLVAVPDTSDEGSHLAYAVQWFSFTAIGGVGLVALLRREAQHERKRDVPIDP